MKCRVPILILVLISLLFFTSCSTPEDTINLDEYKEKYSYGLQVFDMSMEMLPDAIDEFSPDKDRIIKFYNLTDRKTDYIFFVTLNGSLCPIKVDGQQAGFTFSSSTEANSVAELAVNIQLNEDQLLPDVNQLVFTVITENNVQNPDMIFNKVSFAHKIIVPDTIQFGTPNMEADENDYYPKSDEIIERYGNFQFATLQDIETRRYEMITNRSLQFYSDQRKEIRIEAVGDKGAYSLILFCNDKPIRLSGNEHNFKYTLNGDDMLSKELEITVEDTKGSLYALIFPLGNENYMPVLTNKVSFETD